MGLFDSLKKGAKAVGKVTDIPAPAGWVHPQAVPPGKVFNAVQMADEYKKLLLGSRADDVFSEVGSVAFNHPLLNGLPEALKARLSDLMKKRAALMASDRKQQLLVGPMRQLMDELRVLEQRGNPSDMTRIVELRKKIEQGKQFRQRGPETDKEVGFIDDEIHRTLLRYFQENPDKIVENEDEDAPIQLASMRPMEDNESA